MDSTTQTSRTSESPVPTMVLGGIDVAEVTTVESLTTETDAATTTTTENAGEERINQSVLDFDAEATTVVMEESSTTTEGEIEG